MGMLNTARPRGIGGKILDGGLMKRHRNVQVIFGLVKHTSVVCLWEQDWGPNCSRSQIDLNEFG